MGLADAIQKAISNVAEIPGVGSDVTLRTVTTGAYNTSTGAIAESTSDLALKGVFTEVNAREVNGLVEADDRKCTISAADVTNAPTTFDRIISGGVDYQIIRIKTIIQSGVDISYELFLRT